MEQTLTNGGTKIYGDNLRDYRKYLEIEKMSRAHNNNFINNNINNNNNNNNFSK